jgi:hypothetical protein
VGTSWLRPEGKLRRVGKASRGGTGRAGQPAERVRKRGEPQGRERVARYAQVFGGESRRGGGKPRGRNMEEPWQALPEGRSARAYREWTPEMGTTEGRSLDKPHERQSRRVIDGTDGPVGVEQDGIEGQEGRVRGCFSHSRTVRARVLEDEPSRASAAVNVRRAAGKPIPTTSLGFLPPSRQAHPQG